MSSAAIFFFFGALRVNLKHTNKNLDHWLYCVTIFKYVCAKGG